MSQLRDQRPTNVRYYAANRRQEIERVRRRQDITTAFLRELRNVPCTDCGGRFEPFQMDFDHRDWSQKQFTMCSGRASLKNREQITQLGAPLYPADPVTFNYQGRDYDVYQVPIDGTVRNLALVVPGRQKSQFIDPANPDAGLVTWEGSFRSLDRTWPATRCASPAATCVR